MGGWAVGDTRVVPRTDGGGQRGDKVDWWGDGAALEKRGGGELAERGRRWTDSHVGNILAGEKNSCGGEREGQEPSGDV